MSARIEPRLAGRLPSAHAEDKRAAAQAIRVANLKHTLKEIEANDTNYDSRYDLVLTAMHQARELGYAVGFRLDPSEPAWPVAVIELPTGQVSWHLPEHPIAYDGHDTPEKYARCRAYVSEDA